MKSSIISYASLSRPPYNLFSISSFFPFPPLLHTLQGDGLYYGALPIYQVGWWTQPISSHSLILNPSRILHQELLLMRSCRQRLANVGNKGLSPLPQFRTTQLQKSIGSDKASVSTTSLFPLHYPMFLISLQVYCPVSIPNKTAQNSLSQSLRKQFKIGNSRVVGGRLL